MRRRRRTALFWGSFVLILAVIALVVVLVFANNEGSETGSPTELVAVPSVVRLAEAEAVRELDQLGFNVEIAREENADIPLGQVIRQDPRAGSRQE